MAPRIRDQAGGQFGDLLKDMSGWLRNCTAKLDRAPEQHECQLAIKISSFAVLRN